MKAIEGLEGIPVQEALLLWYIGTTSFLFFIFNKTNSDISKARKETISNCKINSNLLRESSALNHVGRSNKEKRGLPKSGNRVL
ncbi:hypothetical protein AMS62_07770 [Bacillus sp. FJAT-18019]|nr:hypothetical protein AMS62_07770 [Bacillus sp. FJAT-18019]